MAKDETLKILDRAISIAEQTLVKMRNNKKCHYCRKAIGNEEYIKVSHGKHGKVRYYHVDCFEKMKDIYEGKKSVRIERINGAGGNLPIYVKRGVR